MMRKMKHCRLTIIMEEENWTGPKNWVMSYSKAREKENPDLNLLQSFVFRSYKNMWEYAVFVKFNCCQI